MDGGRGRNDHAPSRPPMPFQKTAKRQLGLMGEQLRRVQHVDRRPVVRSQLVDSSGCFNLVVRLGFVAVEQAHAEPLDGMNGEGFPLLRAAVTLAPEHPLIGTPEVGFAVILQQGAGGIHQGDGVVEALSDWGRRAVPPAGAPARGGGRRQDPAQEQCPGGLLSHPSRRPAGRSDPGSSPCTRPR